MSVCVFPCSASNNTMFLQESQMLDPADPRVYDGSPYPFGLDPVNVLINYYTQFNHSL